LKEREKERFIERKRERFGVIYRLKDLPGLYLGEYTDRERNRERVRESHSSKGSRDLYLGISTDRERVPDHRYIISLSL